MTLQCLSYIMCIIAKINIVPESSWQCFLHTWCALLCTAMGKLHSKPWLCQTHLDSASFILGDHWCVLPWASFIPNPDCVKLILTVLPSYLVTIGVCCHGQASFQTLTVSNSSSLQSHMCITVYWLPWTSVCHISCALLCTDCQGLTTFQKLTVPKSS